MRMRQLVFILAFAAANLSEEHTGDDEVLRNCEDVDGALHKVGDSYIGPDACNQCKCLKGGSACTKKLCPKDASSRSAEAFKCVDNHGVLHQINETYTHVDGCNTCKCGEHGGACTRRFCVKKEKKILSFCVDEDGNEKALDEAWSSKDGCNKCVCGILGAICTEMVCGKHRKFVDEEDLAEVHEVVHEVGHAKIDTVVDELGDQPCYDYNNKTQWLGNSWLSQDSCNICTCPGNGSAPICTRKGCRVRLERLLQSDLSGGASALSSTLVAITIIFSKVFAAFL